MSRGKHTPREIVIRIKKMGIAGKRITEIAAEIGANQGTICNILQGKCYKGIHVPGEDNMPDRGQVGAKHHGAKLTDEDVVEILRRAALGETNTSIAKDPKYKVSTYPICAIVSGRTWKHIPRLWVWDDRRMSGPERKKRWSKKYPKEAVE